jgi:hypothetical protein
MMEQMMPGLAQARSAEDEIGNLNNTWAVWRIR